MLENDSGRCAMMSRVELTPRAPTELATAVVPFHPPSTHPLYPRWRSLQSEGRPPTQGTRDTTMRIRRCVWISAPVRLERLLQPATAPTAGCTPAARPKSSEVFAGSVLGRLLFRAIEPSRRQRPATAYHWSLPEARSDLSRRAEARRGPPRFAEALAVAWPHGTIIVEECVDRARGQGFPIGMFSDATDVRQPN